MKIFLALALGFATTGCAELHEHALGTRVHRVTIKGRDYVHCSILMDPNNPQQSHDSIEVCRDGLNQSMIMPHQEK